MCSDYLDKLTEIISLRVTDNFKMEYEHMSPQWKKKAKHEALLAIAKVIHESKFNPKFYLGENE